MKYVSVQALCIKAIALNCMDNLELQQRGSHIDFDDS
jgi:hypothetical protein